MDDARLFTECTGTFLATFPDCRVLRYRDTDMASHWFASVGAIDGFSDLPSLIAVDPEVRRNADVGSRRSYEIMMGLADGLRAAGYGPQRGARLPASLTHAVFNDTLLDELGWDSQFGPVGDLRRLSDRAVGERADPEVIFRARVFLAALCALANGAPEDVIAVRSLLDTHADDAFGDAPAGNTAEVSSAADRLLNAYAAKKLAPT